MKDFLQRVENLSPKHLQLLVLDQQKRLEKLERALREPVAIIGIGCRFPGGVHGPDSFWELLSGSRDAITEIPADRWDVDALYDRDSETPGRIATRRGGFLNDVDKFDAAFFGISNREAISMDPQQRLLLETTWEALEHAGIAPKDIIASQTGLFFGLSTADYWQLLCQGGYEAIDPYTATGGAHSMAAGRVAYILGTQGPAVVVDTACSSSLVALHLASQSLRTGDCDLALAGGVNLILSPEIMIALSKARMLAPDGRSKAFDAAADGFVRAEGCGVVAIKLLSRAISDRDNILAVIRGSAVNHDGRSNGLTAPNGAAQEKLLRQALEGAGVKPAEVQYIEAHGTGTSLGDPIEAHALAAVFGAPRDPRNPLYLGSLKTNLGHLEAAAGIAGVIKTVLSLEHRIIPASLHFSQLNPHIDLNGAPLIVAAEGTAWPSVERRIAGVSSFGFSGTNAHVILEAPPPRNRVAESPGAEHVLVLSARTPAALRSLAGRYAEYLTSHPDVSLADLCYTAHSCRSRFEYSLALPAASVEKLRDDLSRAADGYEVPFVEAPSSQPPANKIALPTYPFEGRRYWVEARGEKLAPPQAEVGFYKLTWDEIPLQSSKASVSGFADRHAAPEGTITAIAESVAPQFDSLNLEYGLDRYSELRPELDRLTAEQIARALHECGWKPQAGDIVDAPDLVEQLGVQRRYLQLLGRMLEILGEEGVLERHGPGWKVKLTPAFGDSRADLPRLQAAYPQFSGELELVLRCSNVLADVLQGRVDPLNVLFPDAAFDTAEAIYEKSAGAKVFQTLLQRSVAQAIETFSRDRPIRILEVGGGTGGTASYVARVLPAGRAEYVFTDISRLFATRGAKKFRQYPFFRYEVLDIERDPDAQGFQGQSFDILIASNCLHATGDLRQSLGHVAQLLAPGGMLLLLEATVRERWVDITFGLTEGWWKFRDAELRGDYPLLSKPGWHKLLSEAGFGEITILPPDPLLQQALVIARSPMTRQEKQSWLLIADSSGIAELVAAALTAQGERAVVVASSNPLPLDQAWRGIVDLSSLDIPVAEKMTDTDWARIECLGCGRVLALTKRLVQTGGRLWEVTRGAQCVGTETMSSAIAAAPLWGLGRSIALEHPEIWGGLIDLDPSGSPDSQARLLAGQLTARDDEDQIAFRGGVRYAARLKHCAQPESAPVRLKADGCYLITGAFGGLGLIVARWMAEQGAKRLILVGRNGITGQRQTDALREIEQLGASFRIEKSDITDSRQMAALFTAIAAGEPPLKGVIHAAAVLSRDGVNQMPAEKLGEVLRPKILGTWLLHRHTRDLDLDFLCLFSSTSSLLGAGGLAHYSAANQFLDAFSKYRRSRGLPALAIEWGTWDQMRTVSEEERQDYRSLGLLPMRSSHALAALGSLLSSQESCIVAAAIDWRNLRAVFEARRKRPLLSAIEMQPPKPAAKSASESDLQKLSATARTNRISAIVWEETCRVLRLDHDAPIEWDRGFFEMGMDSLVSVELKNSLETRLGRSLPPMLTFNFPTVRALTSRLSVEFAASPDETSSKLVHGVSKHSSKDELARNPDDDEIANLLEAKLRSLRIHKGVAQSR